MPNVLALSISGAWSVGRDREARDSHLAGAGSEGLRAGLPPFEKREAALELMRAALVEGEQSGPPVEIDFDDYIAGKRAVAERGS